MTSFDTLDFLNTTAKSTKKRFLTLNGANTVNTEKSLSTRPSEAVFHVASDLQHWEPTVWCDMMLKSFWTIAVSFAFQTKNLIQM